MPSIADERSALVDSGLNLRSAAGHWLVVLQSPSERYRTGELAQLGLLCFIYFVYQECLCNSAGPSLSRDEGR